MPTGLKVFITIGLLPLIGFTVFGFMASFEPGVSIGWKIGYAILFGAFSFGAVLPWFVKRS